MKDKVDETFTTNSLNQKTQINDEYKLRYSVRSVSAQSNVYSVKQEELSLSKGGLLSTQNFVIIISLFQGLYSISSLATFMYQKNDLKIDPDTIQLMQGIISIPWCIKPVFGYIFDQLISRYKKTKNIIIIASIMRIGIFSILALTHVSIPVFFILQILISLVSLFENIVCEYLLLISTKRANFESEENQNHLPIYFGFKAFGSVIGVFLGGRVIDRFGNRKCFYINSILPVFLLFFSFLYLERAHRQQETQQRTIKEELITIKQLIFRGKLFYMILFVCFINMTPSFDSLNMFYLTDVLKFNSEDLADFSTFGTIFYILGLLSYSIYFVNSNQKQFFVWTNFILFIISISYFLVIFDVLQSYNISIKLFCLITQGFDSFFSEINFMPILTIWCAMCPNKLEATSITLFTGIMNLSDNLSNYFGSFIMWLLTINDKNYEKFWILLVIQNLYLLIMIIAIIFVEFPEPKKKQQTELEIETQKNKKDLEMQLNQQE